MVYSYDQGLKSTNSKKLNAMIFAGLATLVLAVANFSTSFAAGNDQSGFTTGDCISDGLYGNEPNMANGSPGGPAEQEPGSNGGNVVPTQSPGPFVNNPNDPDNPVRGKSVGQWQQAGVNVPQICRDLSEAN